MLTPQFIMSAAAEYGAMQLDLNFDGSPAPNENGVYNEDDAIRVAMPRTKSRASAEILVIEVKPGAWVHAVSFLLNTQGSASPLTAHPSDARFDSREQAIAYGLNQLVVRMNNADRDASSTAPSRTQINQIRGWAKNHLATYAQQIRRAA